MWTQIDITILSDKNSLEDIYNCFGLFYSLEQEFSRFLSTSDLTLLNIKKELIVSDRFIDVFKLAKEIHSDTDKFFNPLINLKNIWYSKDFNKWLFEKQDIQQNINLEDVLIEWNIIKLKDDQNLDLWWIVKWYWVDLAFKYLKTQWYNDYIINAWWDIYLSWSNCAWEKNIVAIDSPFNNNEIFATIEIQDMAVSTSGTYKRRWSIDNDYYHHILSPETNSNNNEIISLTIVSDKCYIVDAYATACIAMWIQKTLKFLYEQKIEWIIIWTNEKIYKTNGMENYNLSII